MSLAIVYSRANSGISSLSVSVEVHRSRGMPKFSMVGLPEAAVKESKDRVRSALINSGFEFPGRRITVNLAPADLPKEGGRFDLPIAIGILAATKQISKKQISNYEFLGELALSGELRPVTGVLPGILGAKNAKRNIIIPYQNKNEAELVKDIKIYCPRHLLDVCKLLKDEKNFLPHASTVIAYEENNSLDISDVLGQEQAKRALEICAAGKHSLLLIGPPGTGKTMLASRLPTILPHLSEEEALEVASILSISNCGFNTAHWKKIPFRSPHHSSSTAALVGGGRPPRPGEISLAHKGVLFLDELPEFNRQVLESLREPLESGEITISRAAYQSVFPAEFQFISAMNPCPCGYSGSPQHNCRCTAEQIQRYFGKLSGPLLDRIDLQVEVPAQLKEMFAAKKETESSNMIKERVVAAREKQITRQGKYNHALLIKEIESYCFLDSASQSLLKQAVHTFNLSMRVMHRILKVSRTIADLDSASNINSDHLSEALSYRTLDKRKMIEYD